MTLRSGLVIGCLAVVAACTFGMCAGIATPTIVIASSYESGDEPTIDAGNAESVQFSLSSDPKCADGLQNQNETGVDCGGVCGGDCCGNGYMDASMGESGIDCGGSCDACLVGTTYFVSESSGDDNSDGLSELTSWKTIAKVNSETFNPGDSILFKKGDTWRERLVITSSGSAEAYITFGTYGDGAKPRILGSELATDWSRVGTSYVWQSGSDLLEPDVQHPASIFFGEIDGTTTWGTTDGYSSVPSCVSNYSNLTEEYDWCYDDSSEAIYVYAPENPSVRYAFVEVPQRRGSITMESHNVQEYIIIDGFEMLYGTMYGYNDGWPMNYEKRGLIIKNCHIGYIGIRSSASAMGLVIWHSDMLVQNNDIHDCGRRSISYNIYTDNNSQPDGMLFENVIFENNTLHNGYHTTGFDISHGDRRVSTLKNFIFRNNFIYDITADDPTNDPNDYTSMGLYLHTGAATYENFQVYNNVLKDIKQKFFAIGGTTGRHVNLKIFNNVLYGMNPNLSGYQSQAHLSGTHQNLQFNNNIMYGTIPADSFSSRCLYFGGNVDGVASFNNNLYYQEDENQHLMNTSVLGTFRMANWDDYVRQSGWDQNSPRPQNPLFVDPENNDFHLKPESVAIGAGRNVGLPFSGPRPSLGIDDAFGSVGAKFYE